MSAMGQKQTSDVRFTPKSGLVHRKKPLLEHIVSTYQRKPKLTEHQQREAIARREAGEAG